MQKTKLEIIDETVNYYSFSPIVLRGKNKTLCVYRSASGAECAVGRCMTGEMINSYADFAGGFDSVMEHLLAIDPAEALSLDHEETIVTAPLRPEYHGHELSFWMALQRFHDTDVCWDSYGLTSYGKIAAKQLKNDWK